MKISKYVTLIMAFLGIMVVLIFIHEFSHFLDLRKEVKIDEMCILTIPNNLLESAGGYVTYFPIDKNKPHTSEFKAYLYSAIVGFVLLFFVVKYIYIDSERNI